MLTRDAVGLGSTLAHTPASSFHSHLYLPWMLHFHPPPASGLACLRTQMLTKCCKEAGGQTQKEVRVLSRQRKETEVPK